MVQRTGKRTDGLRARLGGRGPHVSVLTVIDQWSRESSVRQEATGVLTGGASPRRSSTWRSTISYRSRSTSTTGQNVPRRPSRRGPSSGTNSSPFIQAGKPVGNALIERCSGRLRDECLDVNTSCRCRKRRSPSGARTRVTYARAAPSAANADRVRPTTLDSTRSSGSAQTRTRLRTGATSGCAGRAEHNRYSFRGRRHTGVLSVGRH